MKLFGLIGHPLGHSFSKAYFIEKFAREKIDACYENYDLQDIHQLPDLLHKHPDLCGFNVTIPYKERILPYLNFLDPDAEAIGAVNTVKVMADGKLKGFNTDIIGIETTLNTLPLNVCAKPTALILGTGGASKAVQYVLRKHDIPFHLVSRNPEKSVFTYETLTPEIIKEHPLIVNATPVGMAPHTDEAPLIPYETITPQHTLFDLIYNPKETLFLRQGKLHNAKTVNGLPLLHAQAEASWSIWNP